MLALLSQLVIGAALLWSGDNLPLTPGFLEAIRTGVFAGSTVVIFSMAGWCWEAVKGARLAVDRVAPANPER